MVEADGTAQDQVGAHNGALLNGTGFAAGFAGQASSFDGVDDHVAVNTSLGNFGTQDFTIDFWVKTTATRQETLLKRYAVCSASQSWQASLLANGLVQVQINGPNSIGSFSFNFVTTTQAVNDGQWHRIGIVRQGSVLRIYRDGQLQDSRNTPDGVTILSATVGPLQVGAGVWKQPLHGSNR